MRAARVKLKLKSIIWILLLAGLAGAVIFIIINMNQPAVGTVAPVIYKSSAAPTDSQTLARASGQQINFNYPDYLQGLKTAKASGGELETFSFVKRPSPFWYLNLQVLSLPSGNVSDDGGYNMRKLNPSRFALQKIDINGASISVFSDLSGGYAKAAFMPHGSKLLSLALSSSDTPNSAKLDSVMAQVLKSVQWVN